MPKSSPSSSRYPPWFDGNVKRTLRLKDFYRRKWLATESEIYRQEFRRLRALLKEKMSLAYSSYMTRMGSRLRRDPSAIWGFVNQRRGASRIPGVMMNDGVELDSPQDVVDAFAEMFASVLPGVCGGDDEQEVSFLPTLVASEVDESEIVGLLSAFSSKHTAGDDLIPSFIVRDCRYVLGYPLKIILNLAIRTSSFPKLWKTARISPVHKKGAKDSITNYRPIAIISNFAKLFERALYNRIYNHVKPFLSQHQHGFLPGRSTVTNLALFVQTTSEVLDAGGQMDVIYTDFSKAFDTMPHDVMLRKLSHFGFAPSMIQLMKSYLTDRSSYVSYSGYRSQSFTSTCGVPQGSNLGPLLFVLFVNDLLDMFSCNVLAYADDIKLFKTIKSEEDVVALQADIDIMARWCGSFGLILNASKCAVMSFTRARSGCPSRYFIDGDILRVIDEVRDLGIIFDSQLSFAPHVGTMCSAASRSLGFVFRTCSLFHEPAVFVTLYCALVRSKLEYASVIWYPYFENQRKAIESVQRRFLKYLSFRLSGVYPVRGTEHGLLLERHGFKSLQNRRDVHSAVFMRKLVCGFIDCPALLERVNFHVPRPSSRYRNTFTPRPWRTNLLRFAPINHMSRNANTFFNDIFLD